MANTTLYIFANAGTTSITLSALSGATGTPAASYVPVNTAGKLWAIVIAEALVGRFHYQASNGSSSTGEGVTPSLADDAGPYYAGEQDSGGGGASASEVVVAMQAVSSDFTGPTAEQIAGELAELSANPLAVVVDPSAADPVTFYRGTTWDLDLTALGNRTGWDKAVFTIKRKSSDDDSSALLQVQVTNGGDAADGLLIIDGEAAAANQTKGTLAITATNPAAAKLRIAAEISADFRPGAYVADIKFFDNAGTIATEAVAMPLMPFAVEVSHDITRQVS